MIQDQNKIDKINVWIKTVISIESDKVSFYKEEDPFTKWDYENYHVVKYVDGRVTRDLSIKDTPSKRLHKINQILTSWGFKLREKKFTKGYCDGDFTWDGPLYFRVEMNTFHTDLFKIGLSDDWITYTDTYIEEIIDDIIVKMSSGDNKELNREIKIRAITKC